LHFVIAASGAAVEPWPLMGLDGFTLEGSGLARGCGRMEPRQLWGCPVPSSPIYVISDLHIGGPAALTVPIPRWEDDPEGATHEEVDFRILSDTRPLIELLERLRRQDPPPRLVLAGDVLDYLAEPAGDAFHAFHAASAQARTRAIVDREAALFAAFRGFVGAGGRLVVMGGNHDLEMALPESQEVLAEAFAGRGDAARGRLTFLLGGEALPLTIGDARIVIEHGNRLDPVNDVDHAALGRAVAGWTRGSGRGAGAFSPPAGSLLVRDAMNPIKGALPFVDKLQPLGVTLLSLACVLGLPGVARGLVRARGAGAAWVVDQVQASLRGPLLSDIEGPPAPPDVPEGAALVDAWYRLEVEDQEALRALFPADAAHLDRLVSAPVDHLAGGWGAPPALAHSLGWLLGLLRSERLRELKTLIRRCRPEGDDRPWDDIRAAGEPNQADVEAMLRQWDAVIFGHTHVARAAELQPGRWYFNSGTWIDLMRWPDPDDRRALLAWCRDLREGRAPVHRRPTFVRIDPLRGGARGTRGLHTAAREVTLRAARRGSAGGVA